MTYLVIKYKQFCQPLKQFCQPLKQFCQLKKRRYGTMYSTDKVDAVRVEVNKRGDKQYGVWQYFTMFDALRNYELRGIFHQNNLDYSDEELLDFTDAKDIERVFPKSVGRWILVSVQRNKKEATEFCKKTWGRKCFKEHDNLSVTYV